MTLSAFIEKKLNTDSTSYCSMEDYTQLLLYRLQLIIDDEKYSASANSLAELLDVFRIDVISEESSETLINHYNFFYDFLTETTYQVDVLCNRERNKKCQKISFGSGLKQELLDVILAIKKDINNIVNCSLLSYTNKLFIFLNSYRIRKTLK